MKTEEEAGRFEVTGHFEVTGRGAFVIGHIIAGMIAPGMRVRAIPSSHVLTICGVECVDNISEKKYWNALVFAEKPNLAFIRAAFPVGTTIEIQHGHAS